MMDEIQFGEYTVRQATAEDAALLGEWIRADADHAGRVPPEFFFEEEPGVGCYVLLDAEKKPVFFFRTENTVRMHIQFGPSETMLQKLRNKDGMIKGLDWLAGTVAKKGITEICFESSHPALVRTARSHMGFEAMPHEMVRNLILERLNQTFTEMSNRTDTIRKVSHLVTREAEHMRALARAKWKWGKTRST